MSFKLGRLWIRSNRFYSRAFSISVLAGVCLVMAGCSSSIFSKDKSNDFKQPANSGGPVHRDCRGMDLSEPTLSVETFRQLIGCLNANHSIPAYEALVDRASDTQLGAILSAFNDELVGNKRRFKDLDQSFQQMDSAGVLGRVFNEVGRSLAQPKLAAAVLKLLHRGVFENGTIRPEILRSIRLIAEEIKKDKGPRETTRKMLETAMKTASLDSYKKAVQGLKPPTLIGRPALRVITESFVRYAQEKIRSEHTYLKPWLWGMADGSLFAIMDHFLYGAPRPAKPSSAQLATMDGQVQAFEYLFRYLNTEHKEDIFRDVVGLFGAMNDSISCMNGTKKIPNVDMFIFNEFLKVNPTDIPYWTARDNVLRMKLAKSVCEYPERFSELERVLSKIAEAGQPLVITAQLVRSLKVGDEQKILPEAFADLKDSMFYVEKSKTKPQNKPYGMVERYRRAFVELLGDHGSITAYLGLADAVAELARSDRHTLANFTYLLDGQDREQLKYLAKFFLLPRNALKGASIYDALSKRLLHVDGAGVYDVLAGVQDLIDSDQEYCGPLFSAFREALLFNDANPVLDFVLSVAQQAESRPEFFNALFELAETPEFEQALRMTSTMLQNGQFKELMNGLLTLMRGNFATVAGTPSVVSNVPPAKLDLSRDRSTANQAPWTSKAHFWPKSSVGVNACAKLDFDTGLAETGDARWNDQLLITGACVNADGRYPDFETFLRYATTPGRVVRDGKSLARFLVDTFTDLVHVSDAQLKTRMYDELSDVLTEGAKFNDLVEMQNLARFWLEKPYGRDRLTVAQAVSRFFTALSPHRAKLQETFNLMASLFEDKRFAKSTALSFDLMDRAELSARPHDPVKPGMSEATMTALKASIRQFEQPEGQHWDEARVDAMAKVKEGEYWNQLLSWKQKFSYSSAAEFKNSLKPMLDRMGDPQNKFLEHALPFFFRFNNDPYDAAWLAEWFQRVTKVVRPIPYYYPGQMPGKVAPTVRLVSLLDMLELIVIDADFTLAGIGQFTGIGPFQAENPHDNYAIKYTAKLGQSGDNMQAWVDELRGFLDKYYNLAFGRFSNYLPLEPELKRRMFNLKQVSVVVSEMIAHEEVAYHPKTGRKLIRNDLGLLRDFFNAILSATPPGYRNVYHRDTNSMSFVADMVGLGVLRNIGTSVWEYTKSGTQSPRLDSLFRILTKAALSADGTALNVDTLTTLDHLLRHDYRNFYSPNLNDRFVFIGRIIDQIFAWTAGDASGSTDPGSRRMMAVIKASLYNAAVALDQMDRVGIADGYDIPRAIMGVLKPLVGTPKGTAMLGAHTDLLEPLLTESRYSNFFQFLALAPRRAVGPTKAAPFQEADAFIDVTGMFEVVLKHLNEGDGLRMRQLVDMADELLADSERRFSVARSTLKAMSNDYEYRVFKSRTETRVMRDVLYWMVNPAGKRALPRPLQNYAARHMRNGDALALVDFIGAESRGDMFFKNVKFLGDRRYIQGAQEALRFLKNGIVDDF